MNIRIGNDIKVNFTIKTPKQESLLNVKQIRCYFINTSYKESQSCCDIIKRFPREPFPQFYTPSKYTLHNCGRFEYNVNPCYTKCDYSTFGSFHDPHWWPFYNGFGINPSHFINCVHHNLDFPKYLAYSELLEGENQVSTYFPATKQIMAGPYKLVVVLVLYEEGWNKNNLHTYTIDYGTIFNLVCGEDGQSGDIVINLDETIVDQNTITKINIVTDTIYINENQTLNIGQNDLYNNPYNIELYLSNGKKVVYNPDDYDYNIKFESDSNFLSIDKEGNISATTVEKDSVAIVTVTGDNNTFAEFTVHVMRTNRSYIGFANTTNAQEIDLDSVDSENRKLFEEVESISGNHYVQNFNSGYYLWIISTKEIKNVTSSSFNVPISEVQKVNDYYCYYCLNPLIATDFNITITLK